MKRILTLLVAIAFISGAYCQTPEKMSYQAVVRNNSGILQANQAVRIKISILQGSAMGSAVFVETHTTTTNANGLATIEIGGGTLVSGNLSSIDWSASTYFIKTETDPSGGTNYSVTGTSQILSVPYALHAKTAKSANYNDLTNKPSLFDGTWASLSGKPAFANVATSGSYNDLFNRPSLFDGTWASLSGKPAFATVATSGLFSDLLLKPTTLTGYGITNGMSTSHPANMITSTNIANWNTAYGWGSHNGLYRPINYVPAWTEIINKPTTVSGFGITDAVTKAGNQTITGETTFKGQTSDMEAPLFEVKNKDNQTIFAVYNEGVRMWVSDGAKGSKGGFTVQGFDMTTDYMVIKPDSSNFYVRDATKGVASSFNIIGIKPSLPRQSLMLARTDHIEVSTVLNLQSNLVVDGNINVAGTVYNTITDIEGNVYTIVTIGTQTWMAENLKTTKYNDGTSIPLVTSSTTWATLSTPAYCWLFNNETTYKVPYGALYNWYTANTGKLCPSGWHIPSNTEWTTLQDYLGGQSVAGGKLKETGTTHWNSPNTSATNEVYFTALPGGGRGGEAGEFITTGNYGYWWTANGHSVDPLFAWGFILAYNSAAVTRADYYYKRNGFSVRCLKN